MAVKAVLFDLDGTLLPMDQDIFIKAYFGGIAKKLAPHGYDPEKLIGAIWSGTMAMIKNDGSVTNEQAFWDYFCTVFGEGAHGDEPIFEEFYKNEFQDVKSVCGHDERAGALVRFIKERGIPVALATNPIFPAIATMSRMRWAGLDPSDFALYTTYENINYTKPNPEYYLEIARRLGVEPCECIMVGNDVSEDMVARDLGMQVFLLTDNLINKKDADISVYPHGGFDELFKFIEKSLEI